MIYIKIESYYKRIEKAPYIYRESSTVINEKFINNNLRW